MRPVLPRHLGHIGRHTWTISANLNNLCAISGLQHRLGATCPVDCRSRRTDHSGHPRGSAPRDSRYGRPACARRPIRIRRSPAQRIQGQSSRLMPGLTWTRRDELGRACRHTPPGSPFCVRADHMPYSRSRVPTNCGTRGSHTVESRPLGKENTIEVWWYPPVL